MVYRLDFGSGPAGMYVISMVEVLEPLVKVSAESQLLVHPPPLHAGSVPQSGSKQSVEPSLSLSTLSLQLVSPPPLHAGAVPQSGSAQSVEPSLSLSTPSLQLVHRRHCLIVCNDIDICNGGLAIHFSVIGGTSHPNSPTLLLLLGKI